MNGLFEILGGRGSGNFGHRGRPGKRGGSGKGKSQKPAGGIPDEVYHGTSVEALKKIIKEGIISGKYRNWDREYYYGNRKGKVFVSTDATVASMFAVEAAYNRKAPAVVIEAQIPKSYFKRYAKQDVEAGAGTAWMLPKVKPEWIKKVYKTPGSFTKAGRYTGDLGEEIPLSKIEKLEQMVTVYIPMPEEFLNKLLEKKKK